ncbi:NADH-ubiquinone oxidoreductase MWFE subunit domain-containing protein [Trichoderma breve]|uniref:NADH dehydrogenase [ubiquinone] 1 alpha subcomplex subunit 1 n=1 Tax=Trichoderma breve TaxID=2034170 RepID=A0A9W9BGD5_9HYPO|nr:NADH-ubiquinone oxidoreductase MWFE subunit domain-containing protein [Trichoderma breve]KAJ4861824.1 NADH-ubiquinone oxidoreductase MWFE subunit domain-containing protein [Trichoderma breve]
MPVPFETLIPYGIMIVMFGVSGTGLAAFKTWQNEGKRPRYSLDQWDKTPVDLDTNELEVMERDRRLTGTLRGQTDNPEAPLGFEFSNGWKLEKRFT